MTDAEKIQTIKAYESIGAPFGTIEFYDRFEDLVAAANLKETTTPYKDIYIILFHLECEGRLPDLNLNTETRP